MVSRAILPEFQPVTIRTMLKLYRAAYRAELKINRCRYVWTRHHISNTSHLEYFKQNSQSSYQRATFLWLQSGCPSVLDQGYKIIQYLVTTYISSVNHKLIKFGRSEQSMYLYNLGIAWAAVFLTYGDMSITASLIASIIIGTIIGTLMLERTRRALARINWFGSCNAMHASQLLFFVFKMSLQNLNISTTKLCVVSLLFKA